MTLQLFKRGVVKDLDNSLLEGAVYELDLAIGSRIEGFG